MLSKDCPIKESRIMSTVVVVIVVAVGWLCRHFIWMKISVDSARVVYLLLSHSKYARNLDFSSNFNFHINSTYCRWFKDKKCFDQNGETFALCRRQIVRCMCMVSSFTHNFFNSGPIYSFNHNWASNCS